MAKTHERVDVTCMAPLEWSVGWAKQFLVALGFIGFVVVYSSKAARVSAYPLALALSALAVMAAAFLWTAKVTLLEDGIAYKRYGRTRFIPYTKIKKVESVQRIGSSGQEKSGSEKQYSVYCGVRLTLVSDEAIVLGTTTSSVRNPGGNWHTGMVGDFGAPDRKGWQLRKDIDDRVRAALDEPEPETTAEVELVRGDRTIPQWLEALKSAAPGDGNAYRGSEGTKETLWRVLEDGEAPREARAGAALALRAHLDEDGKTRMRLVGDACESPKLRVAIETALDEEAEEPRLLHALEQASHPRED